LAKRDLLSAADLDAASLADLLDLAARIKGKRDNAQLAGKTMGLLFFERSLRTRVSFEVAMLQLGGHCINISANQELYDLEPEERAVMDGTAEEHVKDAARTMSRYVDALGVRYIGANTGDPQAHEALLRSYARHATIPVVNLESAMEHPCQAIADVLTMREHLGALSGRRLALTWATHPDPKSLGPAHSVLTLAAMLGMQVTVVHPLGFELHDAVMATAAERAKRGGGAVRIVNDLAEGVDGADVVYARSWGSLKYRGDAEREAMVKRALHGWRVDGELMARTNRAIFMHPLPVRRNVVATDDVLDGRQSVIYDQAGNRVPVQKALLLQLLR
jgi:N-acetylornithine carbamoyltransferase